MIEVSHLTKRYGGTPALRDVSFSVEDGTVCGLLGPNGAGKSTTMNIMTGCLAATSGEVRYDGLEIYEDRDLIKRRIGYLPEQPPLYPDMTPFEYLSFVAEAKRIGSSDRPAAIERSVAECGVGSVQHRLIKNLSKGYRQRVGIAQALLGDPRVVILDEPTVGLDPLQIVEIRALVKALGENRTVIVSSHILSEIRALCDQIVIIARGRLVADDSPDRLERSLAGPPVTTVRVRAPEDEARAAVAGIRGIASVEAAPCEERGACALHIEAHPDKDIREQVFFALAEANLPVVELTTKSASLEDVFIELASDAMGSDEDPASGDDEEGDGGGGEIDGGGTGSIGGTTTADATADDAADDRGRAL